MHSLLRGFTITTASLSLRSTTTCAAFATTPRNHFAKQIFANPTNTRKTFLHATSSPNDKMSDEVAAAKEAAKNYDLSSTDQAGPDTVFDKLLSGEWPSDKVYEDDRAFAFRDVSPQAPVHILVIPKKRDGLVALSKAREDQKDLLGHLMYVAQEVGKKECPKGFRIIINDGEEGAQSVFHLHLHIMGGRQMNWPPG
jgi:histidine triad (HIT) family protein